MLTEYLLTFGLTWDIESCGSTHLKSLRGSQFIEFELKGKDRIDWPLIVSRAVPGGTALESNRTMVQVPVWD